MKNLIQLSAEDFAELIKNKNIKLLDVRERHEFEGGHIKGAFLVPSTNFKEEFKKLKIKKNEKLALYCLSGNRSDFIGRRLLEEGYENIYNLELGIIEWREIGQKLIK